MKTMCASFLFVKSYFSIYKLFFSPGVPCDLVDVIYIKGKCHIQEVGKKVSHFKEGIVALQRESDVLSVDRLEKVG